MTSYTVIAMCAGLGLSVIVVVLGAVLLGVWRDVSDFDNSKIGEL